MSVLCNSCGVKLFGEELGAGLCENCRDGGYSARRPAPRTAPPSTRFADTPYGARRSERTEWGVFRAGLYVLQGSVGLSTLFQLGWVMVVVLALADAFVPAVLLATGLYILAPCILLAWLVGQCLLCGVPSVSNLRPLAYGSAGSTALSGLLLLGLIALTGLEAVKPTAGSDGLFAPPSGGPDQIPIGMILSGLGASLFFLLLGSVCLLTLCALAARQLGDPPLSLHLFVFLAVSFSLPLVLLITALISRALFLLAEFAVQFGLSVWLFVLLTQFNRRCAGR
jgi:hypothetical protein